MAGTVSPTIPTLGDLNATEDPDVRSALVTLRDALNAVFTSANLVDGAQIAAGTIPGTAMSSSAAIALAALANGSSAQVPVAASNGVLTYRTISGDVTVSNTGVTTIGATKVTNAMLAGSIAYSKLNLSNSVVPGDLTSYPGIELIASTTQSIPDSTNTVVTFTNANESFDTDTMHTGTSGTVTFTTAGVYIITAGVSWAANTSGRREIFLSNLNSSPQTTLTSPPSGAPAYQTISVVSKLAAGGTTALNAWQNSGGALNVGAVSVGGTFLSAHYLGKGT